MLSRIYLRAEKLPRRSRASNASVEHEMLVSRRKKRARATRCRDTRTCGGYFPGMTRQCMTRNFFCSPIQRQPRADNPAFSLSVIGVPMRHYRAVQISLYHGNRYTSNEARTRHKLRLSTRQEIKKRDILRSARVHLRERCVV